MVAGWPVGGSNMNQLDRKSFARAAAAFMAVHTWNQYIFAVVEQDVWYEWTNEQELTEKHVEILTHLELAFYNRTVE
jgi:hypothetical protein